MSYYGISAALVTPRDLQSNASHLTRVPAEDLQNTINDVHAVYINDYMGKTKWLAKLTVIEKYLAIHTATLNVRRADSESVAGMSKSISVPKGQDLEQTEYGQMAKKIAQTLPLDWASDDKPASVVIY